MLSNYNDNNMISKYAFDFYGLVDLRIINVSDQRDT